MPEAKRTDPVETRLAVSAAAPKASAAASGDPVIQKLLADRQAHIIQLAQLSTATQEVGYHEDRLKAIDKQLAELGFE